ncbi:lmo0954 family membrane protein [Lysinibacillus parviboronicapiens]|uniref:Lia operon protein LiaI n=1 Tax=Lysinibacillus parviboronicapiens TaxID=436516 RepID=A0ABV2PEC0_9BACI|nr:ABC transporter permease [Lysinibacillus parviboronicapiens]
MKKFLLLTGGIIAACVALALIGPLAGLLFSGLLVALGMHFYIGSKSTFAKIIWATVGLIGVLSAVSNIPAMIGLAAIATIYVIYKKWNGENVKIPTIEAREEDPFTNFEKEWSNLTK